MFEQMTGHDIAGAIVMGDIPEYREVFGDELIRTLVVFTTLSEQAENEGRDTAWIKREATSVLDRPMNGICIHGKPKMRTCEDCIRMEVQPTLKQGA